MTWKKQARLLPPLFRRANDCLCNRQSTHQMLPSLLMGLFLSVSCAPVSVKIIVTIQSCGNLYKCNPSKLLHTNNLPIMSAVPLLLPESALQHVPFFPHPPYAISCPFSVHSVISQKPLSLLLSFCSLPVYDAAS